ncbi:MAG: 6-carboxytetrahydropterin synthase [Candidatus Marinimicrobia bacterium]|nr:6-carboxytetrahydropterin synthase [Candidatus Neomarinimicrobiota bacterium]
MNSPYLTKVFFFNAAHQYGHAEWTDEKNTDVFGLDAKVHGHNYTLEVMVTGTINPDTGFIVDLGHLKKIVETHVIDILDHSQIEKEVDWFNGKQPSSENLVQFIWEQITTRLEGARLHRIRLRETSTIFTDYYGRGTAS